MGKETLNRFENAKAARSGVFLSTGARKRVLLANKSARPHETRPLTPLDEANTGGKKDSINRPCRRYRRLVVTYLFVCYMYGSECAPVPVSRHTGAQALRHALALPEYTAQRISSSVACAVYGRCSGCLRVVMRALAI
jgi:hypothetical protein